MKLPFPSELPHLEYEFYGHIATNKIIEISVNAEKNGFDAIVIGCFYDPGFEPPPIPSNEANLTPWTKSNFLAVGDLPEVGDAIGPVGAKVIGAHVQNREVKAIRVADARIGPIHVGNLVLVDRHSARQPQRADPAQPLAALAPLEISRGKGEGGVVIHRDSGRQLTAFALVDRPRRRRDRHLLDFVERSLEAISHHGARSALCRGAAEKIDRGRH